MDQFGSPQSYMANKTKQKLLILECLQMNQIGSERTEYIFFGLTALTENKVQGRRLE
jgi:hypothetical protein